MKMRIKLLNLFAVCLFLGAAAARADNEGTSTANFLKIGTGARPVGMGGAFCAVADDATAAYWNPAGLATLRVPEVSAMHLKWFQDTNYQFLSYAHPLGGKSTIGGSVYYLSVDDIQGYNAWGDKTSVYEASDRMVALSYAKGITRDLFIGGNLKLINKYLCDEDARAFAADIGGLYRTPIDYLRVGFNVQNYGSKMKFIKEEDPIPFNTKIGVSYENMFWSNRVETALDVNFPRDNSPHYNLGAECWIKDWIGIRAGYKSNSDVDTGVRVGCGVKSRDLEINYAFVPYGLLGNTHRFSIDYRFGSERVEGLPEYNEKAVKLFEEGEELFREKEYQGASEAYSQVLEKYPKSLVAKSAQFRIGEASFNTGEYKRALSQFKKTSGKYPDSYIMPEALYGSGQSCWRLGKFSGSVGMLKKLLRKYPAYRDSGKINYTLGLAYYRQEKYGKALKYFEKADSALALYYSGQCIEKLGNLLPALAKYQRIIDNYPASEVASDAQYGRGRIFYKMMRWEESRDEMRKFVSMFPSSDLVELALYEIAASSFNLGDYGRAAEDLRTLLGKYPRSTIAPKALYLKAESLRHQNRVSDAVYDYNGLVNKYPETELAGHARRKLALLYKDSGNYSGAVKECDMILASKREPDLEIMLIKGYCLQNSGDEEQAVKIYQKVAGARANDQVRGKALWQLGRFWFNEKEYDKIVSNYYHLAKSMPSELKEWKMKSYYLVAESYYELERFEEANQLYRYILDKAPESTVAKYANNGVVVTYSHMGRFDKAMDVNHKLLVNYGEDDPEIQADAALQMAHLFFNKKDYSTALEAYQRFIDDYPADARRDEVVFYQGICHWRLEHYSEAVKIWKEVVENNRGTQLALKVLDKAAYTSFGLGDYNESVSLYRQIVVEYPDTAEAKEAQIRIAQAYYNGGLYDVAIKEYNRFLEKYPDDERKKDILEGIKMCYYGKLGGSDSNDKWLEEFAKNYAREDLAGEAYWKLGARRYETGLYSQAERMLEKVMVDYPHIESARLALYYLGESQYSLGKYEEAGKSFDNFINSYPEDRLIESAEFQRANCTFKLDKFEESVKMYDELIKKYPKSSYASYAQFNVALSYKQLKDWNNTIEAYIEYVRNYKDAPMINHARWQIASMYEKKGNYEKAIGYCEDVSPDEEVSASELFYHRGDCYSAVGKSSKAVQAYTEAGAYKDKGDKYRLAALTKLAELLSQSGEYDKAINVYRDIEENSPDEKWKAVARIKIKEMERKKNNEK